MKNEIFLTIFFNYLRRFNPWNIFSSLTEIPFFLICIFWSYNSTKIRNIPRQSLFDNTRQTLNKIILKLCHFRRDKKKNICLLSLLIKCRLISVCTTVRQIPCICMHMRHEVNGTLENNRALAARRVYAR